MQNPQKSNIEDPLSHEQIQKIVTKCTEQVGQYALKHMLSVEGQERMLYEKIGRELWFASAKEAAHRSGMQLPSKLKKIIVQCFSRDAEQKKKGNDLLNAWLKQNCGAGQRHTFIGILNTVVKKTNSVYVESVFYRGVPNLPIKTSQPQKTKYRGFKPLALKNTIGQTLPRRK
ncbi:Uncharacterised protein [uncultured archaeon]|nr:Uncharacterised protein [uncultured archaeon]